MKIGLVLGAGGVLGASWLIGSLEALADETGWSPTQADYVVGTSAGSVVGALTAAGVPPGTLAAQLSGEPTPELTELEQLSDAAAEASTGTEYRAGLPGLGPGSWRMAVSTMRHPRRHAPAAMVTGWLPRGVMRTDSIRRLVERLVPGEWPEHPGYWAVACDYHDGRRVAFGREDAPPATVGDAVSASCAIPGFYRPVSIDGRRYVDGGVCSPSNLDMLAGRGLDLVVCLNPISSRAQAARRGPAERVAEVLRSASGRRLGHEARKLRAEGTEVVLLQPTSEDIALMGVNLMARARRAEVVRLARATMGQQLLDLRADGQLLPGARRRRPRPARSPATVSEPVSPPRGGRAAA